MLALALSATGLGPGEDPIFGVVSLAGNLLSAGLIALLWLASAIGLGLPLARLALSWPRRNTPIDHADLRWLALALGPAAMLWLNHLLGWAGLLSGRTGHYVAIALTLVGLGFLLSHGFRFVQRKGRIIQAPGTSMLAIGAMAVLLCAAASPPGWLWRSEAGGFDAMSYHLPLVQEWADGQRLQPLPHNVYSFLPSYVEAAFLHIAALKHTGLGADLIRGEGTGVIATHYLHTGLTILAALLVGRFTSLALRRILRTDSDDAPPSQAPSRAPSLAGGLAGAAIITTPWSVVTGSLAYNEMAMVAMIAGAAMLAIDPSLSPQRRALLVALLLGVAAGCKPTALLIAGPGIGLLLLWTTPPRAWPAMLALGLLGGIIAFAPPLIRNYLAIANPIFPAGFRLFGTAGAEARGWSQAQLANFAARHGPEGSFLRQLELLFDMGTPLAGGMATIDRAPRGFMHPQWGILWPASLLAIIALLMRPRARTLGLALLGALVAGCIAWALFTHAQARFLMPMLPFLGAALGVLLGLMLHARGAVGGGGFQPARLAIIALGAIPIIQTAALAQTWLTQPMGRPNATLLGGVSLITGQLVRDRRAEFTPEQFNQRLDAATPEVLINLTFNAPPSTPPSTPPSAASSASPPQRVLLLGDATPLYFSASPLATRAVIYHTVWDRSPLGLAIDQASTQPARWTTLLQAAIKQREALTQHNPQAPFAPATHVLVNFSELSRYWSTYGYDPAITPQALVAWLRTLGEPTREWMPEVDGLPLTWLDIIRQDPTRWTGRALWPLPQSPRPD
jgi:hypothetical protein